MSWIENRFDEGLIVTRLDRALNWGRKHALSPIAFGLGCCAIEWTAAQAGAVDLRSIGVGLDESSPTNADLLIVAGTINFKMAEHVGQVYHRMPDPKYVIAVGGCAVSGGPFARHGYNIVEGIDQIVPVDVYVAGCPPRPEALVDGIIRLQQKIDRQHAGRRVRPTAAYLSRSI